MTRELLTVTTAAVRRAGTRLLKRYSPEARQPGLPELLTALRENDAAVVDVLRPALAEILPDAGWLNDEHGSGPLPTASGGSSIRSAATSTRCTACPTGTSA